jgi:hypothetical protein
MAFVTRSTRRGAGDGSRGNISPANLRRLLRGVNRIPSLSRKYAECLDSNRALSLKNLPVLTRPEFSSATDELLRDHGPDAGSVILTGGALKSPSLSMLPDSMFAEQVCDTWRPLDESDVVVNLFSADVCPSHFFYNRVAANCGATVLVCGALPDSRLDAWLDSFEERGVTALAAPPVTVRRLLARAAGRRPMRWLRKLLLGGPFHDPTPAPDIARHLPDVQVWQLYGSYESWIVGHRGPDCAAGVFHVLPHQHAEIDGDRILVTTTGLQRTPPVIRYEMGDQGRFEPCGCGLATPAFRIEGPIAPSVRVNGHLVPARELIDLALATGDVAEAEVAVAMAEDGTEHLELRVRLADGVLDDEYTLEWIKHQTMDGHLAMDPVSAGQADALQVVAVDRLAEVSR